MFPFYWRYLNDIGSVIWKVMCVYSKIRKKQEHLAEEYFIKYNQIKIRINKYKQI